MSARPILICETEIEKHEQKSSCWQRVWICLYSKETLRLFLCSLTVKHTSTWTKTLSQELQKPAAKSLKIQILVSIFLQRKQPNPGYRYSHSVRCWQFKRLALLCADKFIIVDTHSQKSSHKRLRCQYLGIPMRPWEVCDVLTWTVFLWGLV